MVLPATGYQEQQHGEGALLCARQAALGRKLREAPRQSVRCFIDKARRKHGGHSGSEIGRADAGDHPKPVLPCRCQRHSRDGSVAGEVVMSGQRQQLVAKAEIKVIRPQASQQRVQCRGGKSGKT